MNMYSSQSYCISFFYLQIKPFYMDVFYLRKPLELTPKPWEITPKACGDRTNRKKTLNHTARNV